MALDKNELNSPEMEQLIRDAREALESPALKIFKTLAKNIMDRLEKEYRHLKPTAENLAEMNQLYGRIEQIKDLFDAVDTIGDKEVYPSNAEKEMEYALRENRQE